MIVSKKKGKKSSVNLNKAHGSSEKLTKAKSSSQLEVKLQNVGKRIFHDGILRLFGIGAGLP